MLNFCRRQPYFNCRFLFIFITFCLSGPKIQGWSLLLCFVAHPENRTQSSNSTYFSQYRTGIWSFEQKLLIWVHKELWDLEVTTPRKPWKCYFSFVLICWMLLRLRNYTRERFLASSGNDCGLWKCSDGSTGKPWLHPDLNSAINGQDSRRDCSDWGWPRTSIRREGDT